MKVTTKLLSLLLVLVLVMTLTPAIARAEEAQPETGTVRVDIPFQINPLYEGIITEADLEIPEIPEQDPTQIRPNATTYQTVANAGTEFRKQMKNRAETFTIYVKSESSSSQAVGDAIIDAALKHTGVGTEGDYLAWQYGGAGWGGYRRYNSVTKMYEYDLTFTVAYYTTAAQEQEMNTAVTNLINSLGVKGKSDYDKIYGVYDWLCKNVTYDYANLEDTSYLLKHTAYAALIDRTAVCQGYAVLFYRLMLELGVDARVIVGYGGGPHAWNIVELNNLYYNLDSTWDAGYDEYIWFLNSYWDFVEHEREMEYDTIAFHNEYPLAAESYEPGKTATKDPYICAGYCGANTDNAEWWLGRDGTLTIKGEGDMFDVPSGKDPYYAYWESEITKVVVESGITRVGIDNFYGFTGLKEVQLPATVTSIGTDAFRSCTNLTTVKSAGGMVTIEDRAFSYCPALKTVSLPNTLKTIGSRAFTECSVLNGITLPASLETIGDEAFSYCSGLTSITIPGTVTSIGTNVFYGCGSLTSATLPEGLTKIPYGMFNQCQKLVTLNLPSTLKSIGNFAFSGCFSLSSVTLPSGLESIGSYAFSNCNFTRVQIPESVTAIGGDAFSGCTKLATVNLPKSLTVIADGTFRQCPLTSVTIPAGVTRIGNAAFNQTKLSQVVVPEGVTEIGTDAFAYVTTLKNITLPSTLKSLSGFRGCTGLTSMAIPEGVTKIGDYAFYECSALKYIEIPAGVTKIGYCAFSRCSALTELVLPENLTELPNYMAEGCTGLTSMVIPASVTAVGNASVGGCTNLKEITFAANAPTFQWNSFSGITATVYYPKNRAGWTADVRQQYDGTITWVGYILECDEHDYEAVVTEPTCTEQGYTTYTCAACGESYVDDYTDALGHEYLAGECVRCGADDPDYSVLASGWSGATQWVLSQEGTLIVYGEGNMKNYGYNGGQPWLDKGVEIKHVVIEEGVTAIGTGAFKDLTTLKSITLPESGLTKIGEAAFYGCTALKEITIPENIYTIWRYTFKGCTALENVKLPKTLIKIDQGAFENCTGLPSITMPTNVEIIGSWSFKGCTGLVEADMTWTDATKIREGAFKNCSSLTTIHLPVNIQTLGDSCFYGIGATSFTVPETVTSIEAWCFARAYSLTDVYFEGDAPAIGEGAFNKITLTAYYPTGNATWTADIMQNYGGTVTWQAK